ncbi:MAG TPA: hypothetical protein VG370_29560 [Chloroflexota bacterium]|nr:hypothetical protein [Chloroflexota bacterium]
MKAALAVWWWVVGIPPLHVGGDDALLELYTLHATRGEQLLGPHASFGFHQPGPAYYYLQAPLYLLLGKHSIALHFGALLINLVAVAAILWLAARTGVPWLLYAVAAAVAVYVGLFGQARLSHPLTPFVALMPYGAALLLCARLAQGSLWALPTLVAVTSVIVQAHMSYLPALAVAWLAALAMAAAHGWPTLTWRPLAAAAGIGVVLWTPALVEQVSHDPGNLTRMLRWAGGAGQGAGLGEASAIVAAWVASPIGFILRGMRPPAGPGDDPVAPALLSAAFLGLALAALILAVRRRQLAPATLLLTGLATVGMAAVLIARLAPPVPYTALLWLGLAATLTWATAIGVLLSGSGTRTAGLPGSLAWLGLTAWALAPSLAGAVAMGGPQQIDRLAAVNHGVAAELARQGIARPRVLIQSEAVWPTAAAVILELSKEGHRVSVQDDRLVLFGEQYRARGDEDGEILVAERALEPGDRDGWRIAAQDEDETAHVRRLPRAG